MSSAPAALQAGTEMDAQSPPSRVAAVNETTRMVIAEHVRRTDTYLTRLIGLMGRKQLGPDEGLWISPCKGIHTMWMRFPIDVVFLDEDFTVVSLRERVAPWRVTRVIRSAASVLELPAGAIQRTGLTVGHRLGFLAASDDLQPRADERGREVQ